MSDSQVHQTDWIRDLPDHRDFTPEHEQAASLLADLKPERSARSQPPARVDWREFCGPVSTAAEPPASSAHACTDLVQFFQRRARGRVRRLSRLFLHYNARRLLGWSGECGVPLRATFKALARFGAPPERFWPYVSEARECVPDSFAYGFGAEFRDVAYVRLDYRGGGGSETLARVKSFLAAGFPSTLGLLIPSSHSGQSEICFPTLYDVPVAAHAMVTVGYDDEVRVRSDKGALLVRNGWGSGWGDAGYGWLPYAYVEEGLATDFWTLLKADWLASGEFHAPREL